MSKSNRDLLSGHTEFVIQCVLDRLFKMCSFDFSQNYTPIDLIKHGYIDAMKLFIKLEPHKINKLNENRERLIFSMSLIDNIINILLANNQNKMEIMFYLSTPSQAGLSLTDEGVTRFLSTIPDLEELLETDIAGWDFTLKPWEFQLDLDRRADLNDGHNTLWYHLLKVQYYCIQNKVFIISNGDMYAQVLPGIMPSGFNSTTSTNSAIRAGNHYLLAALMKFKAWCKTMGDDSLEKNRPGLSELYTTYLGKTVKSSRLVDKSKGFEFCSHMFKNDVAYPVSVNKQLFNLLNYRCSTNNELNQRYTQFKHELRHHPKLSVILALVAASGWLSQVSAVKLGDWTLDTKTVTVLTQMPRDCTVSCLQCPIMYSPVCHAVSNTMTKTKTQKAKSAANRARVARLTRQMASTKISTKSKKTNNSSKGVLAKSGNILGSRIGGLFGMGSLGGNIGKFLGNGIASIIGEGDYTIMGPQPSYNVLSNSSQIPKFSTSDRTNIICHREYLGDISGTSAFTNTAYPLNPGLSQTFPWLSTVAENFQEYIIHGCIFEFRPLTTDFANSGVPGVVVMATNYNADSPNFATKQQMENSEYAVSVKPTLPLIHGIECALQLTSIPHRYVRTGSVPSNQDLRLYDYGNFQFATQNNSPTVVLGELWVSYCVEFFKPILPLDAGGVASSIHITRSAASGGNPFGTTTLISNGTIPNSITNTTLTVLVQPAQQYLLSVYWNGTASTFTNPNPTYVGLKAQTYFNNDTGANVFAPNNGVLTTNSSFQVVLVSTLTSSGNATITLGTIGTLPGPGNVDIFFTEVTNSIIA